MPSEFYGRSSGRYAVEQPSSYETTCGASVGVSQGMPNGYNMGPNLAPVPNFGGQSGGFRCSSCIGI